MATNHSNEKHNFHTNTILHTVIHKIDKMKSQVASMSSRLDVIMNQLTKEVTTLEEPEYPDNIYNKIASLDLSTSQTKMDMDTIYKLVSYNTGISGFNAALGYDPSNNQAVLYDCAGLLVNSGIQLESFNPVYNDLIDIMIDNANNTSSPSMAYLQGGPNKNLNALIQTFRANYNSTSKPARGPILAGKSAITNTVVLPYSTVGSITQGILASSTSISSPLNSRYPSVFQPVGVISNLVSGVYIIEGVTCLSFTVPSPYTGAYLDYINFSIEPFVSTTYSYTNTVKYTASNQITIQTNDMFNNKFINGGSLNGTVFQVGMILSSTTATIPANTTISYITNNGNTLTSLSNPSNYRYDSRYSITITLSQVITSSSSNSDIFNFTPVLTDNFSCNTHIPSKYFTNNSTTQKNNSGQPSYSSQIIINVNGIFNVTQTNISYNLMLNLSSDSSKGARPSFNPSLSSFKATRIA